MKKNFIFVAIMMAAIAMVSCSKDDDNRSSASGETDPSNYAAQLKGTSWSAWVGDNQQYSMSFDRLGNGILYFDDIWDMNDNEHAWGAQMYGPYTISGRTITANYTWVSATINADADEGTWHGFTSDKEKTVVYTIVTLTDSKLVLNSDMGAHYELDKE